MTFQTHRTVIRPISYYDGLARASGGIESIRLIVGWLAVMVLEVDAARSIIGEVPLELAALVR